MVVNFRERLITVNFCLQQWKNIIKIGRYLPKLCSNESFFDSLQCIWSHTIIIIIAYCSRDCVECVSDSRSVDYLLCARRPIHSFPYLYVNSVCCSNQLHYNLVLLADSTQPRCDRHIDCMTSNQTPSETGRKLCTVSDVLTLSHNDVFILSRCFGIFSYFQFKILVTPVSSMLSGRLTFITSEVNTNLFGVQDLHP